MRVLYYAGTDGVEATWSGESLSIQDDGLRKAERRKTPRYPFVANAEFSETKAGTKREARVTEIGMNGCYLNTLDPFAEGAAIYVKISRETEFFECTGMVAYSQANQGMGITFRDVNRHFLTTLQKWLLEAMRAPRA